MDLEDLDHQISKAKLLGSKRNNGNAGELPGAFEGDHEKCRELDRRITENGI